MAEDVVSTIVLDLDGPLLDGRARHYACYSAILLAHGYRPLPLEVYWEMKRERTNRRKQLEATGAGDLYDRFIADWIESIEEPEFLELDVVQPGARPALRAWKRQGKRLLLATQRHNPQGLTVQLERLGLARYLDRVLPCEHARGGAGKAEQVRLAAPDLRPEETLWIGDTEVDVEAARALGCRVCAVTCGLRTSSYLQSLQPDCHASGIDQIDLSEIFRALQVSSPFDKSGPSRFS